MKRLIRAELNVGWSERLVRVLLGLPMALSFRCFQYFSPRLGYFFLVTGGILVLAAFVGRFPRSHRKQPAAAPSEGVSEFEPALARIRE